MVKTFNFKVEKSSFSTLMIITSITCSQNKISPLLNITNYGSRCEIILIIINKNSYTKWKLQNNQVSYFFLKSNTFMSVFSTNTSNILIVGHAHINRLLLCHWLNLSLDDFWSIKQDLCCLNQLSYCRVEQKVTVKTINQLENINYD